jgi:hypothetical protein
MIKKGKWTVPGIYPLRVTYTLELNFCHRVQGKVRRFISCIDRQYRILSVLEETAYSCDSSQIRHIH